MILDWHSAYIVSTPLAIRAMELLFALSLGIQTLEYWRMRPATQGRGLWIWSIQRQDIPQASLRQFLDVLFTPTSFSALLALRLLALLSVAIQGGDLWSIGFLFVSNLAILIRWRGAFNGGSDFMTLVVLTGLFIAQLVSHFASPELGWRAGFWYITIQSITSYFMSGSVKLLKREWRDGRAMTIFLNGAIHGPLRTNHWLRKPWVAVISSWSFILWESAAPLALLDARLAMVFCTIAALFHFLVFWYFGLNRFFWAWLATFPAIVWCAGQI
jgi:hypothetical protein